MTKAVMGFMAKYGKAAGESGQPAAAAALWRYNIWLMAQRRQLAVMPGVTWLSASYLKEEKRAAKAAK